MFEGPYRDTNNCQTPNTVNRIVGVRLWGISLIVERETAHDRQLRSLIQTKWNQRM